MIEVLTLEEYRSFQRVELRPGRFTLLVGPNSSGKSSVLEALHTLSQLGSSVAYLQDGQWSRRSIRRRAADSASTTRLQVDWHERPKSQLSLALVVDQQAPARVESRVQTTRLGKVSGDWSKGLQADVSGHLPEAVLVHLEPGELARPAYSDEDVPGIEASGRGLAARLAYLYLSEHETFEQIVDALRAVVDEVVDVRIGRERVSWQPAGREPVLVQGSSLRFDMRSGADLPAHAVSSGTLLTLGLLTAALGVKGQRPPLLLIDEMERALHPRAVGELIANMRRIVEDGTVDQVVATTHSPFVVDCMDLPDVWLTHTRPSGISTLERLADHPEAARLRPTLKSGQLWSVLGEDWTSTGN